MMISADALHTSDVRGKVETDRIALAALLLAEGHEVTAIRWEHGTCRFYFERTNEVLHLCAEFSRGEARVEPNSFGSTISALRRKMNEARSWGTAS